MVRAAETGRREGPDRGLPEVSFEARGRQPRPATRPAARWWREHAGVVIGGAALIAFVLGVVGYRQFVPDRRFTEHVYRALQLFILFVDPSGSPDPAKMPVALEVARLLAPAAAAAASIRALLAVFGQRAARAWVHYAVRNHVLVCGLGPFGARLAVAFQEAGHRVVAIEEDASEGAVERCRAAGVIVLRGDAADRDLLRTAGIMAAGYLVVASADDRRNADIALAAREVAGRRRRALPCYVHVVHPGLSALLGEAALAGGGQGALRMEFFNPWQSVPPLVLDEFPPTGAVLVVGPGSLGRDLVLHAARRSAADRITLVGPGAEGTARDLSGRYPRLGQVCDLQAHDLDLESAELELGGYLDGRPVTDAYVALEDDASALQTALRLSRAVPAARVVVLATEHSGLGTLVSEIRSSQSPIALFDVLERSARPEILLNGTIELLARSIHFNYVRAQAAAGRTAADNPSLRPWDDLPETVKESNRAQAVDVGTKLAAVGCRIRPWTDWTSDGFRFTADEVERMAQLEHERWFRAKLAEGWTFGPSRNDERRTSPYLIPWNELSEEVKEHQNRSAVRAIPELLTDAGYEIVRDPG